MGRCGDSSRQLPDSPLPVDRPLDVLVVEDNVINVKLITALLRKEGCQITVSTNGQEAVEVLCAQGRAFDVVLMDCHMPLMNGWDATRTIREYEQRTGSHMPIIAITANALEGDRERCLSAGMDEYLTKPIDRSRLHDMLQWAAARRIAHPPAGQPVQN
jgi:CheY-like chemotaxis protein